MCFPDRSLVYGVVLSVLHTLENLFTNCFCSLIFYQFSPYKPGKMPPYLLPFSLRFHLWSRLLDHTFPPPRICGRDYSPTFYRSLPVSVADEENSVRIQGPDGTCMISYLSKKIFSGCSAVFSIPLDSHVIRDRGNITVPPRKASVVLEFDFNPWKFCNEPIFVRNVSFISFRELDTFWNF